jgi:organic radical activating enzyme
VAWQTVRDQITSFNCEHVVVTGGEPLMQRRGVDLINDLAGSRLVTVETNGTYDRDLDSRVFLSVSPKLTSAGASPIVPAMILKHEYQLKFVVNTEADIAEIDQLVDKHTVPASNVYLMPQGTEPSQFDSRLPWIVDLAKARGYRVSDRLHIRIWGSRRGV